jgi:predicted Zn-dependent peptidase
MAAFLKKVRLKNNARLVLAPLENSKAVTLLVLFGLGSKYEQKRIQGISHLLEHLVFKGTQKRPDHLAISRELDQVGGLYNAFTSKEYLGFWVKVAPFHLELALDVLSDLILNPKLDPLELEKEKKVILEEIRMIKDDPQSFVEELWERLLYGETPMGFSILGTPTSLKRIKRADLENWRKTYFVGENAVIVLAGSFEKDVFSKVIRYFQLERGSLKQSFRTQEFQKKPAIILEKRETDQTHLILGVRTFGLFDKRRYSLAVLANLLGGIMSSRIFTQLREKKSLCYYVSTTSFHYTDAGYLATQAGVNNDNVLEAIKIILNEYQEIAQKGVSEQELKISKENLKGKILLGLETSNSWANYLGLQELLEKKISLPQRECALIEKVKLKDIKEVARKIFQPQRLNLALVGPVSAKEKVEKIFNFSF